MEMYESVINMREAIKNAAIDHCRRKAALRKKGRDFNLIKKIPAVLAVFIFTGYMSCKIYNATQNYYNQKFDFSNKKSAETIFGLKIAETAIAENNGGHETIVMPLFSQNNPLFLERINALSGKLKSKGQDVNIYWAANEGEYNSEDEYSPFIDRVLSLYPTSNTLIIVSAGDVSNAKITDKLKNFISGGGLFVMAGEVNSKSSLMNIARNGQAVVVSGLHIYNETRKAR
ncbi:MAG: hypothetical protein WAX69_27465 [Victivallales bacterium]